MEFPSAKDIASANLTRLTNILVKSSRSRFTKEKTIEIRNAARNSIGSYLPAKLLELRHTIQSISELDAQIEEVEAEIKIIMDEIDSPITSIPGIGQAMGAQILAEI